MVKYTVHVNGKDHAVEADADMPLLWVIRDLIGLKGTKYGCGMAQCGSCTVHLNGTAVRACSMPISGVGDQKVTTIEGISTKGEHPVQKAWKQNNVPQCGYCQVGQIMNAVAFLESNNSPKEEEIDAAMSGNLCRCGTYQRIKDGIRSAAKEMQGGAS